MTEEQEKSSEIQPSNVAGSRLCYRVMIQVCGKEEGQALGRQDLETFPCTDLLTIDRLWVEASNGHFGFSVQKKIWEECGSPIGYSNDYKKFYDKSGLAIEK